MMTETVDLAVRGEQPIHCASCEQRIGNGLRRLPGVQSVRASSKTQRVEVAIDPAQVSAEQVRAKLEQLGFAAELEGPPGD
jgi:Cu+-exporting ATPase